MMSLSTLRSMKAMMRAATTLLLIAALLPALQAQERPAETSSEVAPRGIEQVPTILIGTALSLGRSSNTGIVGVHVEQNLLGSIGIKRLVLGRCAAKVHVRQVGKNRRIFFEGPRRADEPVAVTGRNLP